MVKSPGVKEFLDKFTEKNFGKSRTEAKEEKVCVFCHKPINSKDFRNEISRREYRISGICQKCQDGVFGKD